MRAICHLHNSTIATCCESQPRPSASFAYLRLVYISFALRKARQRDGQQAIPEPDEREAGTRYCGTLKVVVVWTSVSLGVGHQSARAVRRGSGNVGNLAVGCDRARLGACAGLKVQQRGSVAVVAGPRDVDNCRVLGRDFRLGTLEGAGWPVNDSASV